MNPFKRSKPWPSGHGAVTTIRPERPTMSKFRKKPVVVEAWTVNEINKAFAADYWEGLPDCIRDAYDAGGWVPGALKDGVGPERGIYIPTLEGSMFGSPGDWIICGTEGEFYPIKPAAFAATFEGVNG